MLWADLLRVSIRPEGAGGRVDGPVIIGSLRNTAEMRALSAPSSRSTENLLANIIRHAKCD